METEETKAGCRSCVHSDYHHRDCEYFGSGLGPYPVLDSQRTTPSPAEREQKCSACRHSNVGDDGRCKERVTTARGSSFDCWCKCTFDAGFSSQAAVGPERIWMGKCPLHGIVELSHGCRDYDGMATISYAREAPADLATRDEAQRIAAEVWEQAIAIVKEHVEARSLGIGNDNRLIRALQAAAEGNQ